MDEDKPVIISDVTLDALDVYRSARPRFVAREERASSLWQPFLPSSLPRPSIQPPRTTRSKAAFSTISFLPSTESSSFVSGRMGARWTGKTRS